jgi:lipoprotein-anchoring transpeptidase ErfK/SrfK
MLLRVGLSAVFAFAVVTAVAASRAVVDWRAPSGGAYPRLTGREALWLDVSLAQQRLFVMDGGRKIYTMVVSTGLDDPPDDRTPMGTYYIQAERGPSFYNQKLGEGARYWVSWLNHGEYLLHSVPTDRNERIIVAEARKLGRKASHGCIRLTVPDAKWIYQNIPCGCKIVIKS